MAIEIFTHACHIKRAETCSVAGKKLSPLSWQGEQAYSKSRPATESGHQTIKQKIKIDRHITGISQIL